MSMKFFSNVEKLNADDVRVHQLSGDTDGIIAAYYDLSGNPSVFMSGASATLGNVGIKTETPNEALTVNGSVSATGGYYGEGIGNVNGDFQLIAGEHTWYVRGASGNIEVPSNKGIQGGSYAGNQVMFPAGFGLQLNSLRDGTTYIQTGSAGDVNKTWTFSNDGDFSIPEGGTISSSGTAQNIYINGNLIPTASAFYLGDANHPIAGIYLSAQTLYIASATPGISGLALSNDDNVLTISTGGLRSSIIYTGGLLLSGNNIAADPLYSNQPMTVGGGLTEVNIKVNTTIAGTLSSSGLISQQKNHCVAALYSNQAMTTSDTVIHFTDKDDPNNWWDSTNHKFQPTVAGYYNIMVMVNWQGINSEVQINNQIRKNGNTIALSQMPIPKSLTHSIFMQAITHMNGSSDYLDVSGYTGSNTNITGEANGAWTKFEAFKIS